jgi:phosphoribosylamine--glycine ligase
LAAFAASNPIDLTVVGSEIPLVAGIVDSFRASGHTIIGPTAAAARLEASKAFSKLFMQRAGIPTAAAVTLPDPDAARHHIGDFGYPTVIKADGLAAGKGVVVAANEREALSALATLPRGAIVIEEFLQGEEVSYIVLADHERFLPLETTQDHKAVGDHDQGQNTGGMGAYCDGRIIDDHQSNDIQARVIRPALARMAADGVPYTGFLYAGIMMTRNGPKVLEFNVRLGDPETQALMHRMDSDLVSTLLDGEPFRWNPDPSLCVVLAAKGYPGQVATGDLITGIADANATVFHAGTTRTPEGIRTAGGRVLGVTASGPTLRKAIDNTYQALSAIHFDGMHYRRDIGHKGLRRW